MTPTQLIALAKQIYGLEHGDENWKTPLAKDVGVDRRTVRRWLSGERRIPNDLEAELKIIGTERGVLNRNILPKLEEAKAALALKRAARLKEIAGE